MARPSAKGLGQLSAKHQLIDKANTYLVVSSAIASVVVIFSIFASIKLIDKISYQNQVIGYREEARDQLEENLESVDVLAASYYAFDNTPESIIGTTDSNSKIVLDALPSKYDFPAFITSLEYIINVSGMSIEDIKGTDQELESRGSLINPIYTEIPFSISAMGDYQSVQTLIKNLEMSIRPFNINNISITGDDSELSVTITGFSYYQPAKEIGINSQVVKSDKKFKLDENNSTNLGGDNEN